MTDGTLALLSVIELKHVFISDRFGDIGDRTSLSIDYNSDQEATQEYQPK